MATASLYKQANTDKNLIQSFYARGQLRCIIEEMRFVTALAVNTDLNIGGIKFPKGATFQFAHFIIGGTANLGTSGAVTLRLGHSGDEDYFGTAEPNPFNAPNTRVTMYPSPARILNPTDKEYQITFQSSDAISASSADSKQLVCAIYYILD